MGRLGICAQTAQRPLSGGSNKGGAGVVKTHTLTSERSGYIVAATRCITTSCDVHDSDRRQRLEIVDRVGVAACVDASLSIALAPFGVTFDVHTLSVHVSSTERKRASDVCRALLHTSDARRPPQTTNVIYVTIASRRRCGSARTGRDAQLR